MGQVTHQKSYSKIYRTWIAMLSRCRNVNDPNYKNYGGRGIKVCEYWHEFENFYKDMGEHPFYDAQLDRIDNEKGYFRENCRWVTAKANSRNRRSAKNINTHLGKIVQAELIETIGWTKHQFRWYAKRYGIEWILENFKNQSLPKKVNHKIDRQDIVNKYFGSWLVLSFTSYEKKKGHLYQCRCKCGIEREIPRNNLMRGKTKQCRKCGPLDRWKNNIPS